MFTDQHEAGLQLIYLSRLSWQLSSRVCVIVNAAYLVVGAAVLVLPGWVSREPATWYRLGAAYPVGIVAVVVPASYLALVRRARLGHRNGRRHRDRRSCVMAPEGLAARVRSAADRQRELLSARLLGLVMAVLLVYALRTFATRPLLEWDSWVVWMSKARLLYENPSAAPAALRSGSYGQAPYPLGLPTLEALGFSAMGRFDGDGHRRAVPAARDGLPARAVVAPAGARAFVDGRRSTSLVIVGAPQMLFQLLTRYADVPLGLFVGLGLAAGAGWAVSRRSERWLLGGFALFVGMAGIMKSEGFFFALAACVALAATTASRAEPRTGRRGGDRGRRGARDRAPWQLYCAAYGLSTQDYDLGNMVRPSYLGAHADRLRPTASELWTQLTNVQSWGLLTWVILLALVAGALAARWRLLTFAGVWLVLAVGGLLMTYWISVLPVESHLTNTSNRTIVSLLIGGAAMVPLLVFPRSVEAAE